jgi:membrane protein YqaA with SNARE-associated domain
LLLQDIDEWMNNFAVQYGYLGIFFISLLGSMSLFVPIPYTIVIFTLGGLPGFEPLWIALAAGAGASLGEFSGYIIGVGGRKVISGKYKKKMDFLMKLFKKFGPLAIFIFALTPLPDDLLFIPLGVMRYSLIRALIPAFIGKFFSNLIIAYSGRWSLEIISTIFGLEGGSFLVGTIIGIIFMIIVIIIMFKVDWEKRFSKYLETPDKLKKNQIPIK